jgi:hypothetical protein
VAQHDQRGADGERAFMAMSGMLQCAATAAVIPRLRTVNCPRQLTYKQLSIRVHVVVYVAVHAVSWPVSFRGKPYLSARAASWRSAPGSQLHFGAAGASSGKLHCTAAACAAAAAVIRSTS